MADFKNTLSALGHFWPSDKPDNIWPGRVYMDTFPRAQLHCIGRAPGDGSLPRGRLTIRGLTNGNQSVTLFEAAANPGGVAFNNRTSTQRTSITANYMLVASDHFDESATIRRVSFASAVAEHTLRLFANPAYRDIQYRKTGDGYEDPIFYRQVASYMNMERGIRFRVFRSNVPSIAIEPKSTFVIDFLRLTTPRKALDMLLQFRALLSVICGDLIDLWNTQFLHKLSDGYTQSTVYFPDLVKRPNDSIGFPQVPLLDIGHQRALFRKIVAAWLTESTARRIARGAFFAVLQDKGMVRFSHLRELVTILEMHEAKAGTAPLSKETSRKLRQSLHEALEKFEANEPGSAEWRDVIRQRIDQINYRDAKTQMANFIAKIPKGFMELPDRFAHDLIELRNTLVHDISRITANDQNKLSFFLAQLKALYALSDAVGLGAIPDEINLGASFLSTALHMPMDSFTGDGKADALD